MYRLTIHPALEVQPSASVQKEFKTELELIAAKEMAAEISFVWVHFYE